MATIAPAESQPLRPNAAALRFFAAKDPSRAEIYADPQKLQQAYNDAMATVQARSGDADYMANGGYLLRLYGDALANIYGMTEGLRQPGWKSPFPTK